MICPKCKHEKNTAIDTRGWDTVNSRVRLCENCQYLWSTKETIDPEFNHKGYNKKGKDQSDSQGDLFREPDK